MEYGNKFKRPMGSDAAEMKVERKEKRVNETGMGKADKMMDKGEFNTGKTEGICYSHDRSAYKAEDKYESKK